MTNTIEGVETIVEPLREVSRGSTWFFLEGGVLGYGLCRGLLHGWEDTGNGIPFHKCLAEVSSRESWLLYLFVNWPRTKLEDVKRGGEIIYVYKSLMCTRDLDCVC